MKETIIEKVNALIDAPTTNEDVKLAAGNYLDAIGCSYEHEAAEALLSALEENVCTIDESLRFFKSDRGKEVMGDQVDGMIANFEEAKANGEKYCLCPGCQAGVAVYELKDEMLG